MLPFGEALLRGVCCNVLVCGAVWMASGADSAGGKAVCCFFPVMLFVLCGFEHSVANMFYLRLGLLLSSELMLPQTTLSISVRATKSPRRMVALIWFSTFSPPSLY